MAGERETSYKNTNSNLTMKLHNWKSSFAVLLVSFLQLSRCSINFDGNSFADKLFHVQDDNSTLWKLRNVPGDGSCLFHSLSSWVCFIINGQHKYFDDQHREASSLLRHLSVEMLENSHDLFLENDECIKSSDLVEMVSAFYNMTAQEYLQNMRLPKTWGGGPEIVAISNYFRCPINVYELAQNYSSSSPHLRKSAQFGEKYCNSSGCFHILCVDGR
jgi:hypothetical protein